MHVFAAALVTALLLVPWPTRAGENRTFGDAQILAQFPDPPGFPEGIAIKDGVVYAAGAATFGTSLEGPSAVVAFDIATGEELRRYDTEGEDTTTEHANSSIAFDAEGRLYVLNTQLGIYRLDVDLDVENAKSPQEAYSAPFPDLHPCVLEPLFQPCSPTPQDAPPIPNDIVFDAAGNAYVTDSTQATIWLVRAKSPKGSRREPQVWFQHWKLASEYIGVNGIRFNPDRTKLYLTVSTDLEGRSFVYTLPFMGADRPPTSDKLESFFEYPRGELPDGIGFGQSGRLYVALANPRSSGISILERNTDPDGKPKIREVRLANPPDTPSHPYDSPANLAFTRRGSILVTNHALATGFADPDQFTLLDVFVDDRGAPLEEPRL